MSFVKIKLLTHRPHGRHGMRTEEHELRLPRDRAIKVAKVFYGGEGFTSVHDDTMAAFTPEERAMVRRR